VLNSRPESYSGKIVHSDRLRYVTRITVSTCTAKTVPSHWSNPPLKATGPKATLALPANLPMSAGEWKDPGLTPSSQMAIFTSAITLSFGVTTSERADLESCSGGVNCDRLFESALSEFDPAAPTNSRKDFETNSFGQGLNLFGSV